MTVERLSDEDARILARERGPISGNLCKVLIVDGRHAVDELRAAIEPRLGAEPRLSDCLVPAPMGIAPPAWLPDATFALDRHVRDGGRADDQAALESAVAALMEGRLDRDRPLWSIDVIALDRARTAVVLRLHHCMADGMTAMRIVQTLLLDQDDEADRQLSGGPVSAPAPTEPEGAALLRDAIRWRAAATRRRAGALAWRGLAKAGLATRRERHAAIRRALAPEGHPTSLARTAGPRRQVAFCSIALDEVKRIGHRAPTRATVNDVVLAAVAGGLRHWLAETGAEPHEVRVKVPVSLHRPGEHYAANRDSFIVVHLPLDEPDPLARLAVIAAETKRRKAAHDADALYALFDDVGRLSHSLERLADRWAMSPRVFALNVSNVPGPQGELTVLGSPLRAMHSIAEIADRHVLRVAVVSAGGRLSFGLCADADALDGLHLIAGGIAEELRTLRAAVPA